MCSKVHTLFPQNYAKNPVLFTYDLLGSVLARLMTGPEKTSLIYTKHIYIHISSVCAI